LPRQIAAQTFQRNKQEFFWFHVSVLSVHKKFKLVFIIQQKNKSTNFLKIFLLITELSPCIIPQYE